jgi:hypothetical protein
MSSRSEVEQVPNIPSWSVIFEVLALSFKHATSDFSSSRVVLTRISNMVEGSDWNSGVDHVIIRGDKNFPLMVFGHRQWTLSKLISSFKVFIRFTFKDARICSVGFLDLANDNRLQLSTRRLKVEICLDKSVGYLYG